MKTKFDKQSKTYSIVLSSYELDEIQTLVTKLWLYRDNREEFDEYEKHIAGKIASI
jgi:hypothetical protein